MKRFMVIIMLLSVSLFVNCKKINTMSITNVETYTFYTNPSANDHADWACFPVACFASQGTGCMFEQIPGVVKTGYENTYDNGTLPCNCWWWVDCAYRGAVKFDLSSLEGKGFVSARLKFNIMSSNWSGSIASNQICNMQLYEAHQPWDTVPRHLDSPHRHSTNHFAWLCNACN